MADKQLIELLQQGIAAARSESPESKAEGRRLLQEVVRRDPTQEVAWMWLVSVVETDQDRLFCLRKVLGLNPNNQNAQRGIKKIEAALAQAAQQQQPPPPPRSTGSLPTPPSRQTGSMPQQPPSRQTGSPRAAP
jgi:hypothetical protein